MKIALLGDIAFFGKNCIKNNDNLFDYFKDAKDYLQNFDIVIGNLEAPFCENSSAVFGKSATVSSHPANIEIIKFLNITHVNLANNHIGDFGKDVYENTKKILENNKIDWFGTEEKDVFLNIYNEKVCMMGFCSYNTNPSIVRSNSKNGLNYLDAEVVYKKIDENSRNGYFNILSVHSGQEHVHLPSIEDIKFARSIAKKHSYVYYGHHPHVIQGFEKVSDAAIFYSLGNFIFDDVYTPKDDKNPLVAMTGANKTGLIGEIEIVDGKLVDVKSTPLFLGFSKVSIDIDHNKANLENINHYLNDIEEPEYSLKRQSKISEYINERKKLRNFKWYLDRMNLNSIGIIMNARKNTKLYKEKFLSKLDLYD